MRITGVISPPSSATAITDIGITETQDTIACPHGVRRRNTLQRRRPGLDDEIVERKLERGLAILALRRGGVRFLAHRNQAACIKIGGQIEMRNALLGLDQARRNGAAHGVERNLFIGNPLVQRLYLRGADSTSRLPDIAEPGAARSTSRATMRPCGPEPETRDRSMPRSPASRRARGVTAVPPASLPGP